MRYCLWFTLVFAPLAPAADPPTVGKLERGVRQYAPKADAFALGPRAYFLDHLTRHAGPFRREPTATIPGTYEVLFLSRTRPVRLRVTATVAGKSLNERYEDHMKELFAAFDRDGDGYLNEYEAELIYSKAEFRSMLNGGFGFRGQTGALPSLDVLDRDGDRRVSFDEFIDYYSTELPKITQARVNFSAVQGADQLTAELFARLDADKDGKLSEKELRSAERILLALDADEDETVSVAEVLANSARGTTRLNGSGGEAMTAMDARPGRGVEPRGDLTVELGSLPEVVIVQVMQKYDTNRDGFLTRGEIGFDKAAFDKLDTNKDGKLSAAELEAWRVGEPDLLVTLTCGAKQADCQAVAVAGKGAPAGVEIPKPMTPDRIVLRVGTQTIDIAAAPLPVYTPSQNPYGYLFPPKKPYLEEKDLVGPQYQFLRVAFDPADFDGDGRLSRAEFDRYFELQLKTSRLGLTLSHATRVPSLFQLLDTNGDGRLSVKELRTAYERLIPLEPSGGTEVTKAILQPSASLRLGATYQGGNAVAVTFSQAGYSQPPTDARGPVWFRKMDRNGDGDVSRAEFLGSKEDFDRIDTNHDGLISLEEAEAFDKMTRVKKPATADKK